jgi:hypothetical protein
VQKVEFLQLRYDRLGGVCRRPLSKPCERCTAKRFCSNVWSVQICSQAMVLPAEALQGVQLRCFGVPIRRQIFSTGRR